MINNEPFSLSSCRLFSVKSEGNHVDRHSGLVIYVFFSLGDGRASEQPGLTAIHTIWLREHNRIVEGLKGVNPHWDAELLFEHTRRIVTAELTHIIYNEFLPRLLSWNAVNLYGLKLLPAGKWYFANQLKYFMKIIITMNPAQLNCIPRKRKSNSNK